MEIDVACYAGYRGEETPRRIRFGAWDIAVTEVVDRWLAPDHRYFKCRGDDESLYIIRHDVLSGKWELILFERKKAHGPVHAPEIGS